MAAERCAPSLSLPNVEDLFFEVLLFQPNSFKKHKALLRCFSSITQFRGKALTFNKTCNILQKPNFLAWRLRHHLRDRWCVKHGHNLSSPEKCYFENEVRTQMDENYAKDVNFTSIINKFQVYDIAS